MVLSQMIKRTLVQPLPRLSRCVLSKAVQRFTSHLEVTHVSQECHHGVTRSDNEIVATRITLNAEKSFAIQIDGLITLTPDGSFGGNAVVIKNANDVEVLSSNGIGAIDGQGYIARKTSSGHNA